MDILFYDSFFTFYNDYKFFLDSKIDVSNYLKKIKSLYKAKEELQRFSTEPINLDNLPKQPSDSIREYCETLKRLSRNEKLTFINAIIKALGDEEYEQMPTETNAFKNTKKTRTHFYKNFRDFIKTDAFKEALKNIISK